MSYTKSQPGDAALHAKHHNAHAMILDVPASLAESLTNRQVMEDHGMEAQVVRITRRDKSQLRKFAERILQVASNDLGAVQIEPEKLWATAAEDQKGEKYKVYIYIKKRKVAGLLLAESVTMGRRVTATDPNVVKDSLHQDSLAVGDTEHPALLGISRIWVSGSTRRMGVASQLLDVVQDDFYNFVKVQKRKVAFSQPTAMGAALARKWFGEESGWLVYSE